MSGGMTEKILNIRILDKKKESGKKISSIDDWVYAPNYAYWWGSGEGMANDCTSIKKGKP